MEQKNVGNILSQAKQIEMQLIQQQEQLVSKDGQLAIQVHRLQEEVRMFTLSGDNDLNVFCTFYDFLEAVF